MKISLCMIVKDEEEVIERCIRSAEGLYDELVIADTGSADRTPEIAAKYTNKFFRIPWEEDFSRARNAALDRAEGDYLMWLDADDVLAAPLPDLKGFLAEQRPDMLFCPYRSGGLLYERERVFRRDGGYRFEGRVHEAVPPHGKTMRFPLTVLHLPAEKKEKGRNLGIYLKWAEEEKLSPRDLFYYGRELYYHKHYTESIAVLREMLAGEGWYVNKIAACEVLSRCYGERGDEKRALETLFQSFIYGEPRAAVLCEIGRLFLGQKRYTEAAYWYEGALSCRDHSGEGDFEEPACRDLIPCLQLVVCYWALGEREKALFYQKRAEAIAPAHPSVRFNRQFFDALSP